MKPKPWPCPYCRRQIEIVTDVFTDGIDHLIDEHIEILIRDRPLILRSKGLTRR